MSSKKITAYLPPDMVSAIKMEAAQKGVMHFSELVYFKLKDSFSYFETIPTYSTLEKKFSNILSHFVPSKVGRPWSAGKSLKVAVSLFLSDILNKEITFYAKKYSLSKSSLIELAIRISNKDLNNGIPLFIKFHESDKLLLNELLLKTGATTVTEFLTACNYNFVLDIIRKEVKSLQQ
jgi:hypothetical protein